MTGFKDVMSNYKGKNNLSSFFNTFTLLQMSHI